MTEQTPETNVQNDEVVPMSAPSAEELLAQIQKLQDRIDSMQAAQGIPSDPVEAALKNLVDHIEAHAAQNPSHDFSALKDVVNLTHDALTSKDAEKIQVTVEKVIDSLRHLDLHYVLELARDLRTAVLDRG
jgi:hypothetical protein